jgi:hypothetical protein
VKARNGAILAIVLAIHAFGFMTWVGALGFSADIGTDRQFKQATALGFLTWFVAAGLIVGLWWFGRSGHSIAPIPFVWWFPSYLLVILIVYPAAEEKPFTAPPGALAPTTVTSSPVPPPSTTTPVQPSTTSPSSTTSPEPVDEAWCHLTGVRYVGTTEDGARVCVTLTSDRAAWLEVGYAFACPAAQAAENYVGAEGPIPFDESDRFKVDGFSARIDGSNASGVFTDDLCGSTRFRWTAVATGP